MSSLPIHQILPTLTHTMAQHHQCVLEAPPGAGKTTGVPLALLDQPWLAGQKILLLEPRRLAARAAAQRMAESLGEAVGQTVGYRVRLDSKVSAATRIEVITEGILTSMLQDDPSLDGVGVLIFDEFHERSLDADLGLALALQGRALFREDDDPLRLLVMSATLDGNAVAQLLGDAPVVSSEGRAYPVTIEYGAPWQIGEWIEERVCRTIVQALAEQHGSLLVFLPGQAEIQRVARQLAEPLAGRKDILICPLYGNLNLSEQQQAIAPPAQGIRKIVLATNIAETSLTIEGIRVVIDSGLCREARFDPNTAMTRLRTRRISRAASTQRAGRAGRMEPGICYRLWSETQQAQLAAFSSPEILQADLSSLALQLIRWGIDSPDELDWLDNPPPASWQQSCDLLERLDAIQPTASGSYQLSPHGEQLCQLPIHPRLAHMMVRGSQLGLRQQACELAALLGERDPLRERRSDIGLRLEWLRGERHCERQHKPLLQRIQQQRKRFNQLCAAIQPEHPVDQPRHPRWTAVLIALAYPDRLARKRQHSDTLQLSNGRAARLNAGDPLHNSPWLSVAQLGGREGSRDEQIWLAAELDPALFDGPLASLCHNKEVVEWDGQRNRLLAEQQTRIGALVLRSTPLDSPSEAARGAALIALVRKQGLSLLPWNDALQSWRLRVNFLHQQRGAPWPDLGDQALLDTLEQWLQPYLNDVRHLNHFARLDLKNILQAQLPWPLPQQLDELAPERLKVPSGSRVQIDYSQQPPVLAVKLQEMFGATQTPSVAGVPLLIHLLSPARRPLQVTQDLISFWRNGYQQVQKDMKGRYPKHPWPDDPFSAPATARTKARMGK